MKKSMKSFCKTKIAFNMPLSLKVLLLTTPIWPDMRKEAGGKKAPSLIDFLNNNLGKKGLVLFNESTKRYLKHSNIFEANKYLSIQR